MLDRQDFINQTKVGCIIKSFLIIYFVEKLNAS